MTVSRTALCSCPENRIIITKTHLRLRRMDVDIDILRRDIDQYECDRKALDRQERTVSLDDGIVKAQILYPSAVDKNSDITAVRAMDIGRSNKSPYHHMDLRVLLLQESASIAPPKSAP